MAVYSFINSANINSFAQWQVRVSEKSCSNLICDTTDNVVAYQWLGELLKLTFLHLILQVSNLGYCWPQGTAQTSGSTNGRFSAGFLSRHKLFTDCSSSILHFWHHVTYCCGWMEDVILIEMERRDCVLPCRSTEHYSASGSMTWRQHFLSDYFLQ